MFDSTMRVGNWQLYEFMTGIDNTLQDLKAYSNINGESNSCFNSYIIEYTWKMIQVKIALMIKQINWKAQHELNSLRETLIFALARGDALLGPKRFASSFSIKSLEKCSSDSCILFC